MERTTKTFLGLDPRPLLQEHPASCADAGNNYLPTSGIIRPAPSNRHFMSLNPLQEDRLNNKLHSDVRMPPGFQSVVVPMRGVLLSDAKNKTLTKCVQQGNSFTSFLNLTNNNNHSFPPSSRAAVNSTSPQVNPNVHTYAWPVVPTKPQGFVASLQTSATMQQESAAPGSQPPVACPTTLACKSRNSSPPRPTCGQLTIFFGGMVNVYENVSLDKVQAIMSMAANGSSITTPENSNASKQLHLVLPGGRVKPADPVTTKPPEAMLIRHHPPPETVNVAVPPCSALCSSLTSATASPSVDHSATSSNTPDEPKGSKSPVRPSENMVSAEDELPTNATPMARAVPMARKASLARFLKKRKERMSNLAPYASSSPKLVSDASVAVKTLMSSIVVENNHALKLIDASGIREQPWHPTRPSRGMDDNFVNTELQI